VSDKAPTRTPRPLQPATVRRRVRAAAEQAADAADELWTLAAVGGLSSGIATLPDDLEELAERLNELADRIGPTVAKGGKP
jgi:hypothetical protein